MAFVNQVQLLFFVVFSVVFFSVQAGEKAPFSITMTVKEEVKALNDQGNVSVQHIKPTNIVPGDTVVYSTEYRNNRKQAMNHVVVTNPIPNHLIYIQGSAEQNGVPVTYSINNGETFSAADELIVIDDKGTARPATIADYTHIRWRIPSIKANSKGSIRFSAKLK